MGCLGGGAVRHPFFFDDARLVGDLVWMGSGVGVLGGGDFDGDGKFDFSCAE